MKLLLSTLLFSSLLVYPRIEFIQGKLSPLPEKMVVKSISEKPSKTKVIDSFHGVEVFKNGGWRQVHGRHRSIGGYNFGLKWQCVEFVKRYYFNHLNHEMPDTYGDAVDFFDTTLEHGDINYKRLLQQFRNGGDDKPREEDIIVFGPTSENRFGHIAIVVAVFPDRITVIQQNWADQSRMDISLTVTDGHYSLKDYPIQGWLRKQKTNRKDIPKD